MRGSTEASIASLVFLAGFGVMAYALFRGYKVLKEAADNIAETKGDLKKGLDYLKDKAL